MAEGLAPRARPQHGCVCVRMLALIATARVGEGPGKPRNAREALGVTVRGVCTRWGEQVAA